MITGRQIRVRGQVQGVGFRPFVWQLAQRFNLRGHVLNDPEGVLIYVAGAALDAFEAALKSDAPPLARIDAVESQPHEFDPGAGFEIAASQGQGAQTRVTPDAATCDACRAEIADPNERRFGYAFANCTHCGPRFTILNRLPYDRGQTTMAAFPMCADCAAEYDDPMDRRFHAQPVACAACGPQIWLEDGAARVEVPDVIEAAAARLRAGEVLAIKGLGGFHLACDATNAGAIATLRARKRRPAKPFALMAPLETIRAHADVSAPEAALLCDSAAPIVVLSKAGTPLPEDLAPGQATLGWMLPYTPLHHLLAAALARPLVMTSGNLSGEPQVIGNAEARGKLRPFVDAYLMHDRDIARRLDDSVEQVSAQGPMVLRRARGRVPGTLPLPDGFEDTPQIAAYGGQMKSAICLLKDGQALLGHHLGELDDALTYDAFLQADADYADLFDHRPERVACDMHPDFRASQHARSKRLPITEVQHHHAHLAACLGENLWPRGGGQVAGIILDGVGLGADGTVWGGELLLGDYHGFERRAWLAPAPQIGGDMAAREPWRNALARLDQAGLSDWADALFDGKLLNMARQAAQKGMNSPMSSSAGRLFDAVAACLGICPDRQSFEGEAAMRLEALAHGARRPLSLNLPLAGSVLDPAPLFAAMRRARAEGISCDDISAGFHHALARGFAAQARALVQSGRAQAVALSGGCFQSKYLLEATCAALHDVPVLIHTKTPANDGGLALGQALIAAARALDAPESE